MDDFTPDHPDAIKFNDYLVTNYLDRTCSRYTYHSRNSYDKIIQDVPRTNNDVEGFNGRINSIFPTYPHIFIFIMKTREDQGRYRLDEDEAVKISFKTKQLYDLLVRRSFSSLSIK